MYMFLAVYSLKIVRDSSDASCITFYNANVIWSKLVACFLTAPGRFFFLSCPFRLVSVSCSLTAGITFNPEGIDICVKVSTEKVLPL